VSGWSMRPGLLGRGDKGRIGVVGAVGAIGAGSGRQSAIEVATVLLKGPAKKRRNLEEL